MYPPKPVLAVYISAVIVSIVSCVVVHYSNLSVIVG